METMFLCSGIILEFFKVQFENAMSMKGPSSLQLAGPPNDFAVFSFSS